MAEVNPGNRPSDQSLSRSSQALQRLATQGSSQDPNAPLETPGVLQAHVNQVVPVPGGTPDGVIARFRANKLTRKAALDQLAVFYDAQLDVVKVRLAETVRVRKAEASLKAEEFLAALNGEHLRFLTDLGLRNEDVRSRALIQLNEQTARTMQDIESRSWPPEMINATLDVVVERYKKFMRRLASDLEEK